MHGGDKTTVIFHAACGIRVLDQCAEISGIKVRNPVIAIHHFYPKGSGVHSLLGMIETLPQGERMPLDSTTAWIAGQVLLFPFQPAPAGL